MSFLVLQVKCYWEEKMASVRDLAKLSALAYQPSILNYNDWNKIHTYGSYTGVGFSAGLYVNKKLNEAVFAIRGTDGNAKDMDDFLADLSFAFRRKPEQFHEASKAFILAKALTDVSLRRDHTLYLTGHSLGGALASLVSAENRGLPTVTFNSPGMKNTHLSGKFYLHIVYLWNKYDFKFIKKDKMLHVRTTGDIVSRATGPNMGSVKEVYVDKWGTSVGSRLVEQHSINNMFDSMSGIPWTLEQLGW